MSESITIHGGCHCGQIRFQATVDQAVKTLLCNCSICSACGFEHLIVPKPDFILLSGEEKLSEYQFGTKTAKHLFCKTCGIKSFYQPRSHPDAYSINFNSIENRDEIEVTQELFDGRNWDKSRAKLQD